MAEKKVIVENLSKRYYIGVRKKETDALLITKIGKTLFSSIKRLFNTQLAHSGGDEVVEVWALKDVSFEIEEGEVLGIIGDNGSGKSTLLKILSRVTAPTSGKAILHGKVGSLLEVGSGFHPDLSGRENVYLSGAIQGMKRAYIDTIFDEIVDFAGVEQYIDTPVKYYSSGMYVRLAFAAASYLNPDIIIIDEVLSVGDARFQKKSLERMEKLAKSGKTVLFVSHSLSTVSRLCDRGLYLKNGKCEFFGSALEACTKYLKDVFKFDDVSNKSAHFKPYMDLTNATSRLEGYTKKILTWVSTHKIDNTPSTHFTTGEGMKIRIGYEIDEPLVIYCNVNFFDYTGLQVMTVGLHHSQKKVTINGKGYLECLIPEIRLTSGIYRLALSIGKNDGGERIWWDIVGDTINIEVEMGDYLGGYELGKVEASFAQRSEWTVNINGEFT